MEFQQVVQQQGGLDSRVAAMEQRLAKIDLQIQAASGNAARTEGLLVGSVIAADNIRRYDGRRNHDAENAAIALGAIGLIGKLASAATTPPADIRSWDNLPQRLSFAALQLPVGDYPARLEFFDAQGRRLAALTQELTINVADASQDTVVFLSELKR